MPSSTSPTLEVINLSCRRADRVLFADLSFALGAGEVLQIEGHNGSGKTSLLRMLCGLGKPAAGQILWAGRDIHEDFSAFASEINYVGHFPGIKDELTPLENLEISSAMRGVSRCTGEQALERIGLPMECGEMPCRKLSAGQKRRVALARLLMSPGQLWVLDEPFTALDVAGREQVETLLHEHVSAGGMAVVTSHHPVNPGSNVVQTLRLS